MAWPLTTDFNEAIQNPLLCFSDSELRHGQPELNALGLPQPIAGNFAAVYKVHCPETDRTWAVKCFTTEVSGQSDRYQHISQCLKQARLPFMVDFRYLEQGIRVLGQWYPVLQMPWVHGYTFNDFLKDRLHTPAVLRALAGLWAKLAKRLRGAGIAHGDLQHGNVLLIPAPKANNVGLRLIDYDGMFVAPLAGKPPGEVGHANFQHPSRARSSSYNLEVDLFPVLVIYTAIAALAHGGNDLWERYNNGDNLLFKECDFQQPGTSPIMQELWRSPDPGVHALIGYLVVASLGRLQDVPLIEEVVRDGAVRALTTRQQKRIDAILGPGAAPPIRNADWADPAQRPAGSEAWWRSDAGDRPQEVAGGPLVRHLPINIDREVPVPTQRTATRGPWPLQPKQWVAGIMVTVVGVIFVGATAWVLIGPGQPGTQEPPAKQAAVPALPSLLQPRDEYQVLLARGQAALAQEQFTEAEAEFAKAEKLRPHDATVADLIQRTRLQRLRAETILQEKRAAVERTARIRELLAKADTERIEGRYDVARDKLDEVRKLDPLAEGLQNALAQLKQAEDERAKLKKAFDTAMKAGGDALAEREFKKAIDQYDSAIRVIVDAGPSHAVQSDIIRWRMMAEKARSVAEAERGRDEVARKEALTSEEAFVRIRGGAFWMGWQQQPPNGRRETRYVKIEKDYELAKYAVTQAQWETVMGTNPSWFSRHGRGKVAVAGIPEVELKRFPVECVSWKDVQSFLRSLNEREKGKGWKYRLPTSIEWEYACRNAPKTREECLFDFYLNSGTNRLQLTDANFNGLNSSPTSILGPSGPILGPKGPILGPKGPILRESDKSLARPTMVGSYPPNKLGLCDMHGNVWQWCEDWSNVYPGTVLIRGGSWDASAGACAAGYFSRHSRSRDGKNSLGLRLARVPD